MFRYFLAFSVLITFTGAGADADQPVILEVPGNMGFETLAAADSMPFAWDCIDAVCLNDSAVHRSGAFSARLTVEDSGLEGYLERTEYLGYQGDSVSFSGWLRGDGSSACSAGVWVAVLDLRGNLLGYDELSLPAVPSSSWESFSVSAPKSAFADSVEFGVRLSGPATVWADDFELLIDGLPLVRSAVRGPFPASLDHQFDSGSGIEFGELSDFQMESLVILGKVWSFLKYHHPYVCSGEVNWDYELFRVLPSVLAAEDPPAREAAIMRLLPSVEPLPPVECVEIPDDIVRMRGDYSWLDGSRIGHSLTYLLMAVLEGRHQGESYYVRGTYLPGFYEEDRPLPEYPDDGYRLLALYRFWGLVEYWFPYRYATDAPWSEQLARSLPDFVNAVNAMDYQVAVLRLMAAVGDTHCGMYQEPEALSRFFGELYVPVVLSSVEGRWVITGFTHTSALESPLRRGDVVVSVDGEQLSSMAERLTPLMTGSTPWAVRENLGRYLLRGEETTAGIVIERGGQQFELTIPRVPGDSLDRSLAERPAYGEGSFSVMDPGFGFIDMQSLSPEDVDLLREEFRSLPGIVVDMRGYPSGFPIYELAEFLVPEPSVFCISTVSDRNSPGTFFFDDSLSAGGGGETAFSGPVALLLDEGSISSAEFHAMAWRTAPECMVFGHATNGADGNVNSFRLPGGIRTGFSGMGIYGPDGSETQRVGIIPDVEVLPTVAGLQEGRDEVLEAAVDWLSQASSR